MSLGISYQISAIDDISRTVRKISKNVKKMERSMAGAGNTATKTGRKTSKAFKMMAKSSSALSGKLKGLALAGATFFGFKKVIEVGMKFEDAMAGVAAITGATGEKLKFFEKESIRMSSQFGVSASQIATSFQDIASAKSNLLEDPQALSKIVKTTMSLARAGGETIANATGVMTKSLNMFRVGADEAQRFSDIIIEGTILGAAKLPDFSAALINSGEAAADAGLKMSSYTAIIQAMSKGGASGERIGTRLNALFRSVKKIDPTMKINEKNFVGIVDALAKDMKVGGATSKQLDEEAKAGIRTLFAQRDSLISFLSKIKKAGGATAKAEAKRAATTSMSFAELRARLDSLMIKVFEKMKPTLIMLVDKTSDWIASLDDAKINSFLDSIGSLAEMLKNIGQFIGFIAEKVHDLGSFIGVSAAKFAIATGIEDSPNAGASVAEAAQLPSKSDAQLSVIDINLNDPGNMVKEVNARSELGGSSMKRKSKVKTNMSNN